MDRTIKAIPNEDRSVAGSAGDERSRRCKPSKLIIHYFLDDLSSAEKKDLTDHLAGCDLCSARLLALEISAEISVLGLPASSDSTTADRESIAGRPSSAGRPASWRRERRRNQPAAALTVLPLDDRELLSGIASPVDFGALSRVAEIEPLEMAVPRLSDHSRRYDACGGPAIGLPDLRFWDLAISELFGAAAFGQHQATYHEPQAAA